MQKGKTKSINKYRIPKIPFQTLLYFHAHPFYTAIYGSVQVPVVTTVVFVVQVNVIYLLNQTNQ